MNILIMMIPLALILGAGFVFAFIWAVENGQYEDTETPSYRILSNDERIDP